MGTLDAHPSILELASSFVTGLRDISGRPDTTSSIAASELLDERLAKLDAFPHLQYWIQEALHSTSLKQLETNIRQEAATVHAPEGTAEDTDDSQTADQYHIRDPISKMLRLYQRIVRFLLDQNTYAGVSDDDLSLFKRQFQNSAFTCRLRSCPRATTGFATEEQCRLHETAHTRLVPCTYPDCQYPPFTSSQSLQNHIKKHHLIQPVLRPIRQNRNIATQRSSALEHNSEAEMATQHSASSMLQEENTPSRIDVMNGGGREDRVSGAVYPRADGGEGHLQFVQDVVDLTGLDDSPPPSPTLESWSNILKAKIANMGFYRCTLATCMTRISINLSTEMYDARLEHCWACHLVPNVLRCVWGDCNIVFRSKEGFGRHYMAKHCTIVCVKCDPKEFGTIHEFHQHWTSAHDDLFESE